jgi:hypothetical protein
MAPGRERTLQELAHGGVEGGAIAHVAEEVTHTEEGCEWSVRAVDLGHARERLRGRAEPTVKCASLARTATSAMRASFGAIERGPHKQALDI